MTKLYSELNKGQWDISTAYTIADFVSHLSSSYVCIANSTGNEPPNATYWALLSSGIEWKGAWSAGTYTKNQAVENDGTAYIVNTTSTTEEPSLSATDWDLLTAKGETGSAGTNGTNGTNGVDGDDSYVYIAYASDSSGTGFTTTFNSALDYIAIKTTTVAIPSPSASDFTGLWKNYKGATGSQGIQGIQGEAGTNGTNGTDGTDGLDINWLGAYSGATGYVINDAVSYNGSSYICILASTGNLPTNTTYWNLMALKGTDGTGSGDVMGPASATDGAIVLFDSNTGKLIKNSSFIPTTVGGALINLTNPSAIRFLRVNADNTVTALSDSDFKTAISALGTTDTQTITGKTFDDEFRVKHIATPSNPSAGYMKIYTKSDNKVYTLDSSGTETEIGTGAGGNPKGLKLAFISL